MPIDDEEHERQRRLDDKLERLVDLCQRRFEAEEDRTKPLTKRECLVAIQMLHRIPRVARLMPDWPDDESAQSYCHATMALARQLGVTHDEAWEAGLDVVHSYSRTLPKDTN